MEKRCLSLLLPETLFFKIMSGHQVCVGRKRQMGDWPKMIEAETNAVSSSEDKIQGTEEFAIVERVARIVSSVYGAKPDYARLAAELAYAISFDVFGIVLLHHDRKAVRITVCQRDSSVSADMPEQWMPHYHRYPFAGSMLEQLLYTTSIIVKDYPHGLDGPPTTSGDALSEYPYLHATCIVPLRTKERLLGTLELGSTFSGTYADSTVQRLIEAVAQVLATAIERTQLEGSAEIQDRQRRALKDVSYALTSKMDLPAILTHITDGVATALNVASAIVTVDQHDGRLHLAAQTGLDVAILGKIVSRELAMTDQCIFGSTIRHRQSYISNDIEHDVQFPASHVLTTALAIRSVLSYPLVIDSTIYGVLLLCSSEAGGFTPLKADIVALFATQATIAIHNGLLLEAARQRQRFQNAIEQLEHVSHVSPATNTSFEEEQALFAHVQAEARRTFGVSLTTILRFVSDNLLTNNELDVRTWLHDKQKDEYSVLHNALPAIRQEESHALLTSSTLVEKSEEYNLLTRDTLSLLTQTTQAALARAGVVSELSRLLIQLQQPTNGIKDAWFVTDITGTCIYMNPVAELFCGMRLIASEHLHVSIEHVFAGLLPRIRNCEAVQLYLQDFILGNHYKQELRCVIALEPLDLPVAVQIQKQESSSQSTARTGMNNRYSGQEGGRALLRSMLLENAPSDSHYQFTSHALHDQQGQVTAYALQVRDITTQVRDEKNKSALLSSVSHDLRTPLTTIKAAVTGLLQTDIPWDEQMRREMLEDIDLEADHLTALVNSFVEMSRIEMGALLLEKEWCDIVEIINDMLTRTKHVLGERKVQMHVATALPLLSLDRVQIGRVLYNLIENAVHHSPEQSTILIKIDTVTDTMAPTMVRVQLVDEGCGIPEHEQERVFKAFYGLRSPGSGLGLAICKGIIEAHQGRIWIESAEEGSCFIFTLPIEASLAR